MNRVGFGKNSFVLKAIGFTSKVNPDDAILALFTGGKQGVWYDPSDMSTLFQDVAGTEPVTKDGDPVALMRDKSGSDNHATQTTSASRPVYKTDGILHWLVFDGVDDMLSTNAINMQASFKSHVFTAVQVLLYKNNSMFVEYTSSSYDDAGGFSLRTTGTSNSLSYVAGISRNTSIPFAPVSTPFVLGASHDRVNNTLKVMRNTNEVFQPPTETALPALANDSLHIGGRFGGSFNLNHKLYGLVILNTIAETEEDQLARQYLSNKSGVTL